MKTVWFYVELILNNLVWTLINLFLICPTSENVIINNRVLVM
jgi:hypothetical protein